MTGPTISKKAAPHVPTPKTGGKPPLVRNEAATSLLPPKKSRREQDAFDRAVAALPVPSATDPNALSTDGAKALSDARTLLSTDAKSGDLMVREGEAKQALDRLSVLSPQDFRLAVDNLNSSGHLKTMLEKLPASERSRFLSIAHDKGYVEKATFEKPAGRFEPPQPPDRYRMQTRLPPCVNDAIHAESQAAFAKYRAEFKSYTGRYEAAVGACTSRAQIAALGHPAKPNNVHDVIDPGVDAEPYLRSWPREDYASNQVAYKAVADRMCELSGERKDGSYWLDGEVELSFGIDFVKVSSDSSGFRAERGTKIKGEFGSVKATDKDAKVVIKTPIAGAGVKVDKKGVVEVEGTVGPAKVVLNRDGTVTAELAAGGEAAKVSAYTKVNSAKATLVGGVVAEGKVGDGEARIKVGLGSKGITQKSAREVVTGQSVFDGG